VAKDRALIRVGTDEHSRQYVGDPRQVDHPRIAAGYRANPTHSHAASGQSTPRREVVWRPYDRKVAKQPAVREVHVATGVTLRYLEQGDPSGTAILLLHPWGESLRCFDRLIALMPPSFRVLSLDQRGHGGAEKPVGGYELAAFAADVEAFMDAVDVAAAVLVGSSSGGYVAQQVALARPSRVTGLVLVGAPRSLHGRPPFADEVERLTDPVDPSWVRKSLTWFPRFHDVPNWYIEDRVRDGLRLPAHVWRDTLTGLMTALAPTDIGTITAPTLIIWGDSDDLLPGEDQRQLAAAIPGSRLVVYEDTGHLVLWEQPDRVATDLTAFVEGLETAATG
jgi:pimeloyl-ACP methyl ester carboxylesterase